MQNDQVFLGAKRARRRKLRICEKNIFSFIKRKTSLQRKINEKWGGRNTVAQNRSGPLDHARVDPTTKIESQYRLSAGRRVLYVCGLRWSDCRYRIDDQQSGERMGDAI